MIFKSKR